MRAFLDDPAADAYEQLVDRFLESPQFGERWARHWMDLFRYTESHVGTLYGARPTQRTIDAPQLLETNRQELMDLKGDIRQKLAEAWLQTASTIDTRFLSEIRT